jgi:hypothetical protein
MENTTKIVECYCESENITFLMKNDYCNDELIKSQVISFYIGEPDEIDTKYYTENPGVIAEYEL